jgi:DNA-binding Lrp family transcriptional regulator
MVSAVVLVNTDLNSQDKVLESLKHISGVEQAHSLHGLYDFLVKIKAENIEEIRNITKSKIKKVDGVTSSLTLMIDDRMDGRRW